MSERLTVAFQGKPCYDIVFSDSFAGLREELEKPEMGFLSVCVVSDENVFPLYGAEIEAVFAALGVNCHHFILPAGEESKTLDNVRKLYAFLIEKRLTRHDALVALGGGVVGDLCGFAAATYQRGIAFIQIPTTLLAQVDSSIGGKTGVDFDGYKNMVGAFHMPRLVYINVKTLATLPARQYFSGFAEVMKHGLIKDAAYYEWLLENMDEICERGEAVLQEMIQQSCLIKKLVVEKDPHEKGVRALLNFGHTIGHALEKASGFTLLHGECVALGAVAEAFISWQKNYLTADEYYEIRDMFVPFNLPITVEGLDPQAVLEYTKSDKKATGKAVNYVLLKKVGKAFVDSSVTDDEALRAVKELIWEEDGQ
jgi:3-dehydroquinate synthase